MTAHGYGVFIDFIPCPICKTNTRHYDTSEHVHNHHKRTIFCEVCGITRFQVRFSDGWTFGARIKNELQVTC